MGVPGSNTCAMRESEGGTGKTEESSGGETGGCNTEGTCIVEEMKE